MPSTDRRAAATVTALLAAGPAHATDAIFGSGSPLLEFADFIMGPFAYLLMIIGIVATIGALILGSDMSGFARRAPLVVIAGAALAGADAMTSTLFDTARGAELPPPVEAPDPVTAGPEADP